MAVRKRNRHPNLMVSSPCGDRELAVPCICRAAVTRAYYEMLLNEASQATAMEAAVRVYNYHHPGYAPADTVQLIKQWLTPSALH